LKSGHPAVERFWICSNDRTNEVEIAQRHRRKNMVAGATFDEKRCDLGFVAGRSAIRVVKESAPANDVQFMVVAGTMNIATGVDQGPDDLQMSLGGGPVKWIRVIAGFPRIRVRTVFEKQANHS